MLQEPNNTAAAPLVSVIVPTYNYSGFITETLENLRSQTYGNWECIVVDDGSTDDTAEVVARFIEREPRVSYVRQRNQRQSVAKNNGLAHARGQYVQFLDADDLLEQHKLERHVEYLERHAEVDIVYGGMRYFNAGRPEERLHRMLGDGDRPWMPELSGEGRAVLVPLIIENIMVINSPLLRRSVVDAVGDFDPVLPPVEDWDYWIRCALAGKRFQYVDLPDTLALVRSHPASSSKQKPSVIAALRGMRTKLDRLLTDEELRRLNREMSAQFEAHIGLDEVESGSRLRGARQFLRAGVLSLRAAGKARWFLCALASTCLGGSQVKRLATFSPSAAQAGPRQGGAPHP